MAQTSIDQPAGKFGGGVPHPDITPQDNLPE
jgi:hypothetical protein